MPGPVQDLIVAVPTAAITISLEPAHNALNSLTMLTKSEHLSGLGEWVARTRAAMSEEEWERHRLVTIGYYFALQPKRSWPSFPAYLEHMAALPPEELRRRLLKAYARVWPLDEEECKGMADEPLPVDYESVMSSADAYLQFLRERFAPENLDEPLERRAYRLLLDPPAMQELIVSHLRHMWDRYLEREWRRVRPMLEDAVEAFAGEDLRQMDRLEAAEYVTGGRDVERWASMLERAERIVFVPSAHVGPYLGHFERDGIVGIIFGARLPAGSQLQAPDLSRAEIVVRLSALADDTRLGILKLIADEGEQRSQEIMERLDLSQSATSRHLKQLSATGYLTERRCSGAKCYRLNPERIEDTLQAVSAFLIT